MLCDSKVFYWRSKLLDNKKKYNCLLDNKKKTTKNLPCFNKYYHIVFVY